MIAHGYPHIAKWRQSINYATRAKNVQHEAVYYLTFAPKHHEPSEEPAVHRVTKH